MDACAVVARSTLNTELLRGALRGALAAQPERFGACFRRELLRHAPDCAPLFATLPVAHGARLLQVLEALIAVHDDRDRFAELCRHLALRHQGYGIIEAHYDAAGSALLRALREHLGTAFDEAAEEAWAGLYGDIAEAMIAAAGQSDNPLKWA